MMKIFIFLCFLLAASTLVNCAAVEKKEEEKQEEAIAVAVAPVEEQQEEAIAAAAPVEDQQEDADDDDDLDHYRFCRPGHPKWWCHYPGQLIPDSNCCKYFWECDAGNIPRRFVCPRYTCYYAFENGCDWIRWF